MPSNPLDIALLAHPSYRTVAYLCALKELGLYPAELVLLSGELPKRDELLVEAERFGYVELFFDVTLAPLEWCQKAGTRIVLLDENEINGDPVCAAVEKCSSENVLFSASGILGRTLLRSGKRFIHVHPGYLPDYRGSTCFYYSLLETGDLASTAFFMNDGLDTGPIIASSRFDMNYDIAPSQPLFLDHVLDPYIRAHTLKKVLARLKTGKALDSYPNPSTSLPACYVMHPMLRILATHETRSQFTLSRPVGIFEKTTDCHEDKWL